MLGFNFSFSQRVYWKDFYPDDVVSTRITEVYKDETGEFVSISRINLGFKNTFFDSFLKEGYVFFSCLVVDDIKVVSTHFEVH